MRSLPHLAQPLGRLLNKLLLLQRDISDIDISLEVASLRRVCRPERRVGQGRLRWLVVDIDIVTIQCLELSIELVVLRELHGDRLVIVIEVLILDNTLLLLARLGERIHDRSEVDALGSILDARRSRRPPLVQSDLLRLGNLREVPVGTPRLGLRCRRLRRLLGLPDNRVNLEVIAVASLAHRLAVPRVHRLVLLATSAEASLDRVVALLVDVLLVADAAHRLPASGIDSSVLTTNSAEALADRGVPLLLVVPLEAVLAHELSVLGVHRSVPVAGSADLVLDGLLPLDREEALRAGGVLRVLLRVTAVRAEQTHLAGEELPLGNRLLPAVDARLLHDQRLVGDLEVARRAVRELLPLLVTTALRAAVRALEAKEVGLRLLRAEAPRTEVLVLDLLEAGRAEHERLVRVLVQVDTLLALGEMATHVHVWRV